MTIFNCRYSTEVACVFLMQKNIKKLSELNTINLEKRQNISHYWLKIGFNDSVLIRALPSLHGESLNIMLTAIWQMGIV